MVDIVQTGNPVLREKTEEVREDEFGKPALYTLIAHMKEALDSQEDGAALAAPQIGVAKRIFVISEKIFGPDNPTYGSNDPHFVFINPVITKRSRKTLLMDEGCLSVRGTYGNVPRSMRATVTAFDEKGVRFVRGASGLLAQVFQHECDHLDGILFTDRAQHMWEIEHPPNQKNKEDT